MNEQRRRKILLAVAFLLPLVFILGVFATTFLPSARLNGAYDFVYATCTQDRPLPHQGCAGHLRNLYLVSGGGRLLEQVIDEDLDSDHDGLPDRDEHYRTRLFLHHAGRNESEEISLAEAQRMDLDDRVTAPDGISVEAQPDPRGGFFLFFGQPQRPGYYLVRDDARRRLHLDGDVDTHFFHESFLFLGWVAQP